MRYTIRLLILITTFVIMLILRKTNRLTKEKFIIYLSLLLTMTALPIDDLFLRFSSPESYMNYYYFYTKPKEIVYGKDSCMIRAIDDVGRLTNIYLRKEEGSYKMNYGLQSETIKTTNFYMNGKVDTERVTGTNDYYLVVYLFSNNDPIKIHLDDGNELKLENRGTLYYGQMYIKDYSEGRYIYINGSKVLI